MELKNIDKKILEAHTKGYPRDADRLLEKRFALTEMEKRFDETHVPG